ncbi:unnamed protein product [Mytilus coruscus]|uniref:Reverse transcriptase RNase H-like domain-containing protein n=1 Tax=Mytilus coruscus TaxID=42192 RepID=A0A6J8D7S6_MYTCO|nr:unnamed protein product [Mytilus coruscus]
MPFGLCCAAQTFERLMETILAGLQWETCLVYIDDIIVFGKTLDGMLDNLRQVFDKAEGKEVHVVYHQVGAVLSQKSDEGLKHVVAYASRTLSKSERKYCVTRKELLAVVCFVKHFKPHLYGRKFTVRTDHGSLKWLFNFKNPEGQIARCIETLGSFEMQIQHRPGVQHRNADALSRIPCKQCGYHSGLEKETVTTETEDQHDTVNAITRFDGSNDKDDDSEHHNLSLKEIQENDHDLKIVTEWVKKINVLITKILLIRDFSSDHFGINGTT